MLEYLLELVAAGLHPSTVVVELANDQWSCRVEFDDWHIAYKGDDTVPYSVSSDQKDLRDGVPATVRKRFEPRPLSLEMPSRRDVDRWIAEVAVAGCAIDYLWIGTHRCLTKPVEWLCEPVRSALLHPR